MLKIYGKTSLVIVALLTALCLISCGGGQNNKQGKDGIIEVAESYEVKDAVLELVILEGGTFTMGNKPDGRPIQGSVAPVQVVLDGYAIGKYPVSQKLWKAVMGNNPSSVKADELPVDRVSYIDCEKFVKKLSKLTGVPFVIPTEAQWEFAFGEGKMSMNEKCTEWCFDYNSDEVAKLPQLNPKGPAKGSLKVVRTGVRRDALEPHSKAGALTFRVAVNTGKACPEAVAAAVFDKKSVKEGVAESRTFNVNGLSFNMVGVKGGKFNMGGTDEQGPYAEKDEKPVREIEVGDFSIGQTEVTVGLWRAVMGNLPFGNDEKTSNKPVVNVSWYDCQEFILKLNMLTGRKFRLPDEAEWEYAARGGRKSRHYRYAGGDDIAGVAVYGENSDHKVKPVKSKRPNELGIYDMSGNAWEWCKDAYAPYGSSASDENILRVMRGGSAAGRWDSCRLSNRSGMPAINIKGTFGFRIAL